VGSGRCGASAHGLRQQGRALTRPIFDRKLLRRPDRLASSEFVGHGEEVVEDFGGEVLQADEDAVVFEIVDGGVVEVGGLGEEGGAVLAVDADEDRVGFGGFVGGDAGHEVAADLEGRGSPGDGFFHVGES